MNNLVLLLDDDDRIRFNLKLFLEDEGFECLTAENAESAIEILAKSDVMVAIVEIRLPGISGDEFIKKVFPLYPKLSYIIHTGSMEFELDSELIQIGISNDLIFTKPIEDMHKFSITIKSLINKHNG